MFDVSDPDVSGEGDASRANADTIDASGVGPMASTTAAKSDASFVVFPSKPYLQSSYQHESEEIAEESQAVQQEVMDEIEHFNVSNQRSDGLSEVSSAHAHLT